MSVTELSIEELRGALVSGVLSSPEVFAAFRSRALAVNPRLHAFEAIEDETVPVIGDGPLAGIPFGLKQNIAVQGRPLTCNSRILENYRPPYDATVTRRLQQSGAVLLGQTNMDEFAMGSSTENSAAGPTRNPWDLQRTPGGSSGGSAAAVAAGLVPFALGSDTGGSIRQPASFCGVVGLKPTYGRISRYGLVAFGSSLDQIGPLTRNVRDAATVYGVLAGHDSLDGTSLALDVGDPLAQLEKGPKGLCLGVPWDLMEDGVDPQVRAGLESTLKLLESAGTRIVDVKIPTIRHAISTYYILCTAEASSNLGRYDGVRYGQRRDEDDLQGMLRRTRTEGFGAEVKLRILLGTYVLSAGYYDAYYRKAGQVRTLMRQEFEEALAGCDAVVTPTAPTPAFPLGERVDDPLQMYLSDTFTVPANLTGLPAVSVPTGLTDEGLPLGLQLCGRALDETGLLRAAQAVESVCDFEQLRRQRFPLSAQGDA